MINMAFSSLIPSGKLTVCYCNWLFIVDLPVKTDDLL